MATSESTWSERFAAHIKKRGINNLQASLELKVGQSQVHYWAHGSIPREKTRKRIERWSKGEVVANTDAPEFSRTG